jgi:hypothetical protein
VKEFAGVGQSQAVVIRELQRAQTEVRQDLEQILVQEQLAQQAAQQVLAQQAQERLKLSWFS